MTVGQVGGPLVGAMAAARMGFRPSFVLGAAILLGTAALVQFAAPVFSIVVARIAHRAGGGAIGVINSARIGAAFIGPVAATTLLAWTSPLILYPCLGAVGAACVPVAWRGERAASAIART